MAGAYLNASMSSVVIYIYFNPTLTAMLCELVTEYNNSIMKDVRMVIKLDNSLNGRTEQAKF